MSRVTFENPTRAPVESRIVVIRTVAQKREPPFRMRQPSSSNQPRTAAVSSARCGLPSATSSAVIEAREVLTDDFLRFVSLDPLRAAVPAAHASLRIEHEDRILLDSIDRQLKSLVALPDCSSRRLTITPSCAIPSMAAVPRATTVARPQRGERCDDGDRDRVVHSGDRQAHSHAACPEQGVAHGLSGDEHERHGRRSRPRRRTA